MMATFAVLLIGGVLGWHLSSAYHERRWVRDVYRRAEGLATGVYRLPEPAPPLHQDQDCVELPTERPSIKAICLDAHFGLRHRIR